MSIEISVNNLVLGYLKIKRYSRAAREFENECKIARKPIFNGMKNGQEHLLPNLENLVNEYCALKKAESKVTLSGQAAAIHALWQQFDAMITQLRYLTTGKNHPSTRNTHMVQTNSTYQLLTASVPKPGLQHIRFAEPLKQSTVEVDNARVKEAVSKLQTETQFCPTIPAEKQEIICQPNPGNLDQGLTHNPIYAEDGLHRSPKRKRVRPKKIGKQESLDKLPPAEVQDGGLPESQPFSDELNHIFDTLLNSKNLQEKIADNINKVVTSSHLPSTNTREINKNELVDSHPTINVDEVLNITRTDPSFESLFNILDDFEISPSKIQTPVIPKEAKAHQKCQEKLAFDPVKDGGIMSEENIPGAAKATPVGGFRAPDVPCLQRLQSRPTCNVYIKKNRRRRGSVSVNSSSSKQGCLTSVVLSGSGTLSMLKNTNGTAPTGFHADALPRSLRFNTSDRCSSGKSKGNRARKSEANKREAKEKCRNLASKTLREYDPLRNPHVTEEANYNAAKTEEAQLLPKHDPSSDGCPEIEAGKDANLDIEIISGDSLPTSVKDSCSGSENVSIYKPQEDGFVNQEGSFSNECIETNDADKRSCGRNKKTRQRKSNETVKTSKDEKNRKSKRLEESLAKRRGDNTKCKINIRKSNDGKDPRNTRIDEIQEPPLLQHEEILSSALTKIVPKNAVSLLENANCSEKFEPVADCLSESRVDFCQEEETDCNNGKYGLDANTEPVVDRPEGVGPSREGAEEAMKDSNERQCEPFQGYPEVILSPRDNRKEITVQDIKHDLREKKKKQKNDLKSSFSPSKDSKNKVLISPAKLTRVTHVSSPKKRVMSSPRKLKPARSSFITSLTETVASSTRTSSGITSSTSTSSSITSSTASPSTMEASTSLSSKQNIVLPAKGNKALPGKVTSASITSQKTKTITSPSRLKTGKITGLRGSENKSKEKLQDKDELSSKPSTLPMKISAIGKKGSESHETVVEACDIVEDQSAERNLSSQSTSQEHNKQASFSIISSKIESDSSNSPKIEMNFSKLGNLKSENFVIYLSDDSNDSEKRKNLRAANFNPKPDSEDKDNPTADSNDIRNPERNSSESAACDSHAFNLTKLFEKNNSYRGCSEEQIQLPNTNSAAGKEKPMIPESGTNPANPDQSGSKIRLIDGAGKHHTKLKRGKKSRKRASNSDDVSEISTAKKRKESNLQHSTFSLPKDLDIDDFLSKLKYSK